MEAVKLNGIEKEMNQLILHSDIYRKGDEKPPHFLIKQKNDNGRAYVTNYIADTLYENKLRRFGGLDICLEYTLDGSLKQVKQIFSDISSNAVYTNEYEGVVAMDVTKLARYLNEFQVDYFLENIVRVAENATMVIYYDGCAGKRMDALVDRIKEALHAQTLREAAVWRLV